MTPKSQASRIVSAITHECPEHDTTASNSYPQINKIHTPLHCVSLYPLIPIPTLKNGNVEPNDRKWPKTPTPTITHFVTYGQPGSPPPQRILATDWKTCPYVSLYHTPWLLSLNSSKLSNLINGFKPREMEDKWFICSQGPSQGGGLKVHFYRGWTVHQIFTVQVQVGDKGEEAKVKGLGLEGSETVIGEQNEQSAKEMVTEVCRRVLGVGLGADD